MESLFGRFPYLVEDIFGLLNVKTLSCCGQINKVWRENLEEYRIYLVKKVQKRLKNQNIVYGSVTDYDKEEDQNSPEVQFGTSSISKWTTRIMLNPTFSRTERNITVEQLTLPFLVKLLKYFCDFKLKDSEVIFTIIFHKKRSILEGMFVKNYTNGVENIRATTVIIWQWQLQQRRAAAFYSAKSRQGLGHGGLASRGGPEHGNVSKSIEKN